MNENQNYTIKVKLSSDDQSTTLGVGTLFLRTYIGWVKINGFRITKATYSTSLSPDYIDVWPPSFKNRFGNFSPIFFMEPNDKELSKKEWMKLKQKFVDAYQREKGLVSEEINPDDIPDFDLNNL